MRVLGSVAGILLCNLVASVPYNACYVVVIERIASIGTSQIVLLPSKCELYA